MTAAPPPRLAPSPSLHDRLPVDDGQAAGTIATPGGDTNVRPPDIALPGLPEPQRPATLDDDANARFADSAGSAGFEEGGVPNLVRTWFGRFICPMSGQDLDLLTLWCLHTHFMHINYSTPRLSIDSPLPEAGKTTVLEHLQRLAVHPMTISSISSPALLARALHNDMRTLLFDEVEKSLHPDRQGVGELISVINTGYKRGGSRPVLVAEKGEWVVAEMSTFAPVAMAGISPLLPDDTLSRTLTVLLLPAGEDSDIEDTDWELIETEADQLREAIETWAIRVTDIYQSNSQPDLPDTVRGRAKEKWRPLKRAAETAGGDWPQRCDALIARDVEQRRRTMENNLKTERPTVAIVMDIAREWPPGVEFWPSEQIREALITRHPERWGPSDRFPRGLTLQRLGMFLGKSWHLHSQRKDIGGKRISGYYLSEFQTIAARLGLPPVGNLANPSDLANPAGERHD